MAFLWHSGHDKTHFIYKSHIQHAVRLIKNYGSVFGQKDFFVINQISQSSRRTDNKIVEIPEFAYLMAYAHPPDTADGVYFLNSGEIFFFPPSLFCMLSRLRR